jgi:hypothetical protein
MRYYSRSTGSTYIDEIHGEAMPPDAQPITDELYLSVIANPMPGKIRSHDAQGLPILVDPPHVQITADELCASIDRTTDTARRAVAGDPLRAVEYQMAATEAQAFAAAGYPAEAVPRTVAAWAMAGRSAQQAADNILTEAAQYNEALHLLRETRLRAKEQVRQAMNAGEVEQAQDIAVATIAAIQAAIAGIGNNPN